MKNFLSILFLALLAFSFQSKEKQNNFSTPKAVVETFLDAAEKMDKTTLSSCFSNQSAGEWNGLRKKTATRKELMELKNFVSNAVITNVEMQNDLEAIVFVTFNARDEQIHTIKEEGRWFVLGF